MSYTPPTIHQTGIRKWLEDKGYNYDLFVTLVENGLDKKPTAIRDALRKGEDDRLSRATVRSWVKHYLDEKE